MYTYIPTLLDLPPIPLSSHPSRSSPSSELSSQKSLSFFLKNFFNWRKIALKCCVGFCHPITQISHNYIYLLHREPPSPILSYPSISSQSTKLAQHGALGSNGCVSTKRYLTQDHGLFRDHVSREDFVTAADKCDRAIASLQQHVMDQPNTNRLTRISKFLSQLCIWK